MGRGVGSSLCKHCNSASKHTNTETQVTHAHSHTLGEHEQKFLRRFTGHCASFPFPRPSPCPLLPALPSPPSLPLPTSYYPPPLPFPIPNSHSHSQLPFPVPLPPFRTHSSPPSPTLANFGLTLSQTKRIEAVAFRLRLAEETKLGVPAEAGAERAPGEDKEEIKGKGENQEDECEEKELEER